MRKSPGRVARPICLTMALLLFVATLVALAVGTSERGETGLVALQSAFTLAILAVLWALIGIMFTVARPDRDGDDSESSQRLAPPVEPKVNWFQDATVGSGGRRR